MAPTGQPRLAPIAASHINTAHLRNISITPSAPANARRPSFSNRPSSRKETNKISSPPSSTQALPPDLPLYLLHGFRWPRPLIRIHVIVNNLEDAAPDYTMASTSNKTFINCFHKVHPDLAGRLPGLSMVEEYDPNDEDGDAGISEEGAWVADCVVRLNDPNALERLQERGLAGRRSSSSGDGRSSRKSFQGSGGITVDQVMARGITSDAWSAIAELRDKVAEGADVGWWVVYNGDPERLGDDEGESAGDEIQTPTGKSSPSPRFKFGSSSTNSYNNGNLEKEKGSNSSPSGFRKFFKRHASKEEDRHLG